MKVFERYFCWNDFLDYADYSGNAKECSHESGRKDWFGTDNFDEAIRLARYGWTEFLHKIKQTNTDCWEMLNNIQLWETKHSLAGSSVDMGRYIIGMPDCMSYQDSIFNDRFHACPRFVNIVVNISCSWRRTIEHIFNRGISVLNTINTLETNNVKTRVVLLENVLDNSGKNLYRIFIPIKDYQDIFYLEKLMFPIAHASFLRRIILSVEEREPVQIRNLFGFYRLHGYGEPSNIFDYDDKNTLYFGVDPLSEHNIQHWIDGAIHGDVKDYSGDSDFDKHVEQLKSKSAEQRTKEDLQQYMADKTEKHREQLLKQQIQEKAQNEINQSIQERASDCGDKSNEQSFGANQQSCDCGGGLSKHLSSQKQPNLPALIHEKSGLPVPISFYKRNQLLR